MKAILLRQGGGLRWGLPPFLSNSLTGVCIISYSLWQFYYGNDIFKYKLGCTQCNY